MIDLIANVELNPAATTLHDARVVLAHDWLVGMRGGEWVLDRLARLFGPTELYTLVDSRGPMTEAIRACSIVASPLQQLPGAAGSLRRWYLPLMPWAVERLRLPRCDLVISTSSAVMKSIQPPPDTPHLCYCHSPARYVWEQSEDYEHGRGGHLRRAGLRAVRRRFQQWDRRTVTRVTRFLANSRHTAERIRRCYNREAHVVYPPVRTAFFTPDESTAREDWYLVVAALEPYKRTDLVIEAANRAGFPLRIAGDGSQRRALEAQCGQGVTMLGRVSDEVLRDLYRRARALIFPQLEDFGIIPVEAQACGCPVIAFNRGGAAEIITERTGVRFDAQDVDALVQAVHEFERRSFVAADCRANAERFTEEAFDRSVLEHASELLDGDTVHEFNEPVAESVSP